MVYISSPMIPTASRLAVMQAQSQLATAQTELSSGTLADPGLTLGGQTGQLISLTAEQNRLQAIQGTNAVAATRLTATASALDSVRAAASSFLASLTAAASSGGSTAALAATARSNLQTFLSAMNTSVSGQYIFAGINTDTKPVTDYGATSTAKAGVDGAFAAAFGTAQTSAGAGAVGGTAMQSFLDGSFAGLFGSTAYGSNWSAASDQVQTSDISASQSASTSVSANASAFRQLAEAYTMVTEFTGPTMSADAVQSVVKSATTLLASAVGGLTDIQAGVGITQSAISSANDSMAAQVTLLSRQTTALDGIDGYALTTKVSALQTQIEASYELTAKLQQMSLVNYLG